MAGATAFWLSIVCRRVLFANIAIVGLLGVLVLAHIAWGIPAWDAMSFHLALATDTPIKTWSPRAEWREAGLLTLGQQALFLAIAGLCLGHAYWLFRRKDYSAN